MGKIMNLKIPERSCECVSGNPPSGCPLNDSLFRKFMKSGASQLMSFATYRFMQICDPTGFFYKGIKKVNWWHGEPVYPSAGIQDKKEEPGSPTPR